MNQILPDFQGIPPKLNPHFKLYPPPFLPPPPNPISFPPPANPLKEITPYPLHASLMCLANKPSRCDNPTCLSIYHVYCSYIQFSRIPTPHSTKSKSSSFSCIQLQPALTQYNPLRNLSYSHQYIYIYIYANLLFIFDFLIRETVII